MKEHKENAQNEDGHNDSPRRKSIADAIRELKAHLDTVARVYEWAEQMRYEKARTFRRHFIRHFHRTPSDVLTEVRVRSLVRALRANHQDLLEVAFDHSLFNWHALNNFTNRHLGCPPTRIREMSDKEIRALLMDEFGE